MVAASDTTLERGDASPVEPDHVIGIGLAFLALLAYWFTGPLAASDQYVPLADAFLRGGISIPVDRPWMELVPVPGGDGAQYSPFPPVPALTLTPVVELLGLFPGVGELSGNVMSAIVGAANVALAWYLLVGIGVALRPRLVIVIGFAFTTHWWVAGMAGTHHYAAVVGAFFLLIALNLAVRRRWPAAVGLALGLAAGSRLPTGLALPLLLAFFADRWRPTRAHAELLVALAVPAALFAAYNVARFASPFDVGYAHIPAGEFGLVTDEPWFRHGLLSPLYIPRHLYAILLEGPRWVDGFPYLKPSLTGLSLTLSAPFLFWAVSARGPLVAVAWLSVALVMLPDVMHGSWGFSQFGYRFVLDAIPVLLLLLGWGFRDRASWSLVAAVVVGVAVHAWGIVVWNWYEPTS